MAEKKIMEVNEASVNYQISSSSLCPKGYKQTEVGLVSDDWDVKPFSQVAWFQEGPGLRNWQFTKQGMKVINVTNLENGVLNLERTDRYITFEEFEKTYKHFAIDSDDIVIASSGNSYCKISVVRSCDLPLLMNTSVIRFKPINGFEYGFLLAYLKSYFFKNQIDLMITGGAQPNFGPYHLRRVFLPVPPDKEQRAIAEALSDVDALIASLEKLITKKRAIKTATMQQLLTGKKRLPGFGGEWKAKRLGDICQMKSGEGITSANIDEYSEFPCFGGNGLRGYSKRYTHNGSYALIGRQGALCGNIVNVDGRFFASEHAIVVTPEKETDIQWLSRVLTRMNLNQYTESSAQPGLSISKLLVLECIVPSHAEQTAIATILADMDADISALKTRCDKTQEIKQGMMQELLTGRTRLI